MKKMLPLAAALFSSLAFSAEINLKFAHIYPPEHAYHKGAEYLSSEVEKRTEGAISISIFPAGQLGDEKAMADGIRRGGVDISFVGPGEISKRYPAMSVIEAPFIFQNYEHGRRVLDSDQLQSMYDEMEKVTRSKLLSVNYYGARQITSNKPIESADDLLDMKLRTPDMPIYFDTLRALGARPTPMSLSEVYLALSQGVVDGQENPVPTIYEQRFYEVQKYVALTNHIMAFTPLLMSERSFNKLPEEYQQTIKEVAVETQELIDGLNLAVEQDKIEEMKERGVVFTQPNQASFVEKIQPVIEKYSSAWGEDKYKTLSQL
ncbi:sialic acid TRAP transporter substrate-binding protein SiaP [Photobacterium satsumensis]|uniref:sialic acid TRAP transporter substrate-binding protein SiaP n=1 Tax=Photobacterium satsumensis TaxID=2910239 RepID=UPI003D0B8B7F